MTVIVDDAGWGCPIGGVLVAGLRVETGEYASEVIAPEHFQAPRFASKSYLTEAQQCTVRVFHTLNVPERGEVIQICSGYVHRGTHEWLRGLHYQFEIVEVEGPLQNLIEASLLEYLHSLGFPYAGSTEEYGKLFYDAIVWLKGGDPNAEGMLDDRLCVAKSGWASFPFYRDFPYTIARAKAAQAKRARNNWRGRRRWRGSGDDE